MSGEVSKANISKRRTKEPGTERPSRVKRTAAQLAHLEDLVEEKKPGSLYGFFSVFELNAPPSNSTEGRFPVDAKAKTTRSSSSSSSTPMSSSESIPNNAKQDFMTNNAEIFYTQRPNNATTLNPIISRNGIQSLTVHCPSSDLCANRTAGVLCGTLDTSVSIPTIHHSDHSFSPSSNMKTIPRYSSFPSLQNSLPIRSNTTDGTSYNDNLSPSKNQVNSMTVHDTRADVLSEEFPIMEESWKWSSRFMLSGPRGSELARLEDCLSEDIPIRAILYGWDSIGERWELPPFWQIIRMLDETMFHLYGPIERLGVFWNTHLLMRYHSDPTPQRATTLPKFFNAESVDFEGDYYIGNFLPWPSIREMTKNPLHPCRSKKWFQKDLQTLKLLWPYRLEDCFTRSTDTGLLKLSAEFSERAHDLNCWTFGPDMYEEYPIVIGAAPSRGMIPGAPGLVGMRGAVVERGKRPVRRCVELQHWEHAGDGERRVEEVVDSSNGEAQRKKAVQDGIGTMVEQYGLDYQNLHWREEQRDGRKVMYFTLW